MMDAPLATPNRCDTIGLETVVRTICGLGWLTHELRLSPRAKRSNSMGCGFINYLRRAVKQLPPISVVVCVPVTLAAPRATVPEVLEMITRPVSAVWLVTLVFASIWPVSVLMAVMRVRFAEFAVVDTVAELAATVALTGAVT